MDRFLRFALVGAFSTLFHYALFIAGVHLELAPTTVISSVTFLISAVFNFLATRAFTFQSREPMGPASLRFAAMVGMGLALNTLVMWLLLSARLHYIVCQVAATALVMAWNYVVASRWVFAGAASR